MVEKELGLKDKTEIEKIGIKTFNEACRASVLRYAKDWKVFIDRIGRWVEYDDAYMTMDATYMESVWWAVKNIHDKGLLYEGRKVLLYCPHCETPLARAEIQMDNSYKDVTEKALTVKFELKNPKKHNLPDNTYLLAWTTTPWTLPGNVALAINPTHDYVLIKTTKDFVAEEEKKQRGTILEGTVPTSVPYDDSFENFILEKTSYERLKKQNPDKFRFVSSVESIKFSLAGLEYKPLYEVEKVADSGKKSWYVSEADFVTTEEGTGIVHTAAIYGEDDYELGIRLDLPMVPLLDEKGHFNDDAPELVKGQYFKKANSTVIEDLEKRGLLFKTENYTHSYPHCHRCGTPLFYNAITSWFINIQKVKDKLIANNEKINWVPEHLKHGRFLNIVEGAPDWTISRNRYWASPLPIWKSQTGEVEVIGSLDELKEKTKSTNRYLLMRHGETEANARGHVVSIKTDEPDNLTKVGREQVLETGKRLEGEGIDLTYASPFVRTQETVEILKEVLSLKSEQIITDPRLGEWNVGEGWQGKRWEEVHKKRKTFQDEYKESFEKGESLEDVKKRVFEFLYEIEKENEGKTILIVSHSGIIKTAMAGIEKPEVRFILKTLPNAEVAVLDFAPIPHNENYELDFHRPYIDEVKWKNKKGEVMTRIPEVIDGWVEAASMPFAEYHYPFENEDVFKERFPSDFISEYIAQTRTWFYYMHAISTLLYDSASFKNVVTTGTILADDGSKMSKSKGNYTDPMINMNKYSSDALRYYLMTSVVMRAEDLRFSDQDIKEVQSRLLNILWNTYQFYKIYTTENQIKEVDPYVSDNVLDKWILARLNELLDSVTKYMDEYNTVKAGRPIRDFVSDFSTWYVRRSRDRFKSGDKKDRAFAISTTKLILLEFSKISAPFIPFMAESLYKAVEGEEESVHLEGWSKIQEFDEKILEEMKEVREIVSLGLEARDKAGIKVRQPLAALEIRSTKSKIRNNTELLQLIKDEVNVKEIMFAEGDELSVELNTALSAELIQEGNARELIRQIQSLRKKEKLNPNDVISLTITTDKEGEIVVRKYEGEIKRVANISKLTIESGEEGFNIEIQ